MKTMKKKTRKVHGKAHKVRSHKTHKTRKNPLHLLGVVNPYKAKKRHSTKGRKYHNPLAGKVSPVQKKRRGTVVAYGPKPYKKFVKVNPHPIPFVHPIATKTRKYSHTFNRGGKFKGKKFGTVLRFNPDRKDKGAWKNIAWVSGVTVGSYLASRGVCNFVANKVTGMLPKVVGWQRQVLIFGTHLLPVLGAGYFCFKKPTLIITSALAGTAVNFGEKVLAEYGIAQKLGMGLSQLIGEAKETDRIIGNTGNLLSENLNNYGQTVGNVVPMSATK